MLTVIKAGGTGPEDVETLRVGKAYIKGGTEALYSVEWSGLTEKAPPEFQIAVEK